MKKEIFLTDGTVCVAKKYRRARCLRIAVHRDGSVILSLPWFVSYERGRWFLESRLGWIREKTRLFHTQPKSILFHGNDEEYRRRREETLALVECRLEHFRERYGVRWTSVRIRNQKTRWGSCSRNGALSFNYRLLFLSEHLRDYVIVHELCHLIEFNHSPKFWELVEKTFPEYRSIRRELRLL